MKVWRDKIISKILTLIGYETKSVPVETKEQPSTLCWKDCETNPPPRHPFMLRYFDVSPKLYVLSQKGRQTYAQNERRIERTPETLQYVVKCQKLEHGYELFFRGGSEFLDSLWEGFEWEDIGHRSKACSTNVTMSIEAAQHEAVTIHD